MERVGCALGDDFLLLEQPQLALLANTLPPWCRDKQTGLSSNALQKQPSLPGSCTWEAEGPVPAVGMEWLQGKPGTCSSLGKGRGGPGQQSPGPPRGCTVGATNTSLPQLRHWYGSTETPHRHLYPLSVGRGWQVEGASLLCPTSCTHSPSVFPTYHTKPTLISKKRLISCNKIRTFRKLIG